MFWIVDTGSSHRGALAVVRLQQPYPNLILVYGPEHANWLNQIEIYFSIAQRMGLTSHDFLSLAVVEWLAPKWFPHHFEYSDERFRGLLGGSRPVRRGKWRSISVIWPSDRVTSLIAS